MKLTTAEVRLRTALKIFVCLFAIAVLIYGAGPFIGPYQDFVRALPFVGYSVVKVFTLMLVCLYAAGDPRGRRGLIGVAIGGHLISVAAMVVLLLAGLGSTTATIGSKSMPIAQALFGAIALDGVIVLVLTWLAVYASPPHILVETPKGTASPPPLTPADRLLRTGLVVLGVLFVIGAFIYEAGALNPATQSSFRNLPFVTNSVVKVGTLALVALYAAGDIRSRIGVVGILFWAHVVSVVTQLLFWLGAANEPPMTLFGQAVPVRTVLLAGAGLDAGIALLLRFLRNAAYNARFVPGFLTRRGYRCLIGLSDVIVIGEDKAVPPVEMATRVDVYFAAMTAKRRIVHQAVLIAMHLHPIFWLDPPLGEMDAELRLAHVQRHFADSLIARLVRPFWRRWVRGMIRVAQQLAYVGYYSDPRSEKTIGYVRFKDRARVKQLTIPEPGPHPLKVALPEDIGSLHEEADVCIIGTGAGGSVLAYRLAEQGRNVLLLERGHYVEPREFTDDEVVQIGQLYDEGIFQQTRDLKFTILQGSCVGGTTVVNNAVCFDPPASVVARWNNAYHWDANVHYAELEAAAKTVRQWLPISSQKNAPLNPSYPKFVDGARLSGAELEVDAVDANIKDCFGCGYCNIGCRWGRKLSMLDTVLPWAQAKFKGKVRIIAECKVERILQGKRGAKGRRAEFVCGRLSDGRLLTVNAKTVIVSAGTIASSWLLMESGVGAGLPVGEGLSFNMGHALTAEFTDKMDAYDGLQISHFGRPRPERGWVFETWWNPPVAQALNMPGWFERHYDNMRRYPYLMAAGALMGTETNGRIAPALTGGPDVLYLPTTSDRRKLADALIEMGTIMFAAGARRVMANSLSYHEFTHPNQLGELIAVTLDPEELALGTGHPQGGNAISASPGKGVVDPEFRVHGWENLYVCDASVFPSSLTVNPQLTVMALAQYAAPRIR